MDIEPFRDLRIDLFEELQELDRPFITFIGGAVVDWPIAAHAQPTRVARIGYVSGTGSAADPGPFVEALQQGMREHGYVIGKDFIVEYRGAEGRQARVPELIAELVQAKVDVLVTPTPIAIRAAKQATDTIPIVMVTSIDPVASGIIDSLAKPGRNITGIFTLTRDLSAKRLEFLKDMVPKLARVGILADADEPVAATGYRDYEAPARALQIELRSVEVRGPNPDLDTASRLRSNGVPRRSSLLPVRCSSPTERRLPIWRSRAGCQRRTMEVIGSWLGASCRIPPTTSRCFAALHTTFIGS
jgi:ABC transporter substrate binding protein